MQELDVPLLALDFQKRLTHDNERRAQLRSAAIANAQRNLEQHPELSFRPVINSMSQRLFERIPGNAASVSVFDRLEREALALSARRKEADDAQRKKESTFFSPATKVQPIVTGEAILASWEGSKPAHAWAEKRISMIETAKKLRAKKRQSPRLISGLSSTAETPRAERLLTDSLPLPSLPSPRHGGNVIVSTRMLQREAQRQRASLREVGALTKPESPPKFPHLKPNAQFLGYRVPASDEHVYLEKNNRRLVQRLERILNRVPEYATFDPVQIRPRRRTSGAVTTSKHI